jgi:hypothetical protein
MVLDALQRRSQVVAASDEWLRKALTVSMDSPEPRGRCDAGCPARSRDLLRQIAAEGRAQRRARQPLRPGPCSPGRLLRPEVHGLTPSSMAGEDEDEQDGPVVSSYDRVGKQRRSPGTRAGPCCGRSRVHAIALYSRQCGPAPAAAVSNEIVGAPGRHRETNNFSVSRSGIQRSIGVGGDRHGRS